MNGHNKMTLFIVNRIAINCCVGSAIASKFGLFKIGSMTMTFPRYELVYFV
jgi:hypothetical protein